MTIFKVIVGCDKLNDRSFTEPAAFMPTYSITRGCKDPAYDISAKVERYPDVDLFRDISPYFEEIETQTYSSGYAFKVYGEDRVRHLQRSGTVCRGFLVVFLYKK